MSVAFDPWLCGSCHVLATSNMQPCVACGSTEFVKGENSWNLSPGDYRALVVDSGVQPSRRERLTRWIDSLHRLTRLAAWENTEPERDDLDLFWIRLWGALNELEDQMSGAKILREKAAGYKWGPKMGAYVDAEDEVLSATEQLLVDLSEEDVIYVDYRRQCAAHLQQRAYRLGIKRDGKGGFTLKTSRNFELIDKEVPVEEAREVIRRLDRQHGDVRGVAMVIAQKILPTVERLWIAQSRSSAAIQAL